MKRKISLILFFVIGIKTIAMSYSKEVPFTQDDRDRLIRLEVRLEESYKSLETRIIESNKSIQQQINDSNNFLQQQINDSNKFLQQQINDLRSLMLTGFGILFMGMFTLVGFVIWDRRTALAPAIKKNKDLEEREEKIEKTLKEYAKVEPKLGEIMKSLGLI